LKTDHLVEFHEMVLEAEASRCQGVTTEQQFEDWSYMVHTKSGVENTQLIHNKMLRTLNSIPFLVIFCGKISCDIYTYILSSWNNLVSESCTVWYDYFSCISSLFGLHLKIPWWSLNFKSVPDYICISWCIYMYFLLTVQCSYIVLFWEIPTFAYFCLFLLG